MKPTEKPRKKKARPEIPLVAKFCNITDLNLETFIDFCRDNRLAATISGMQRGYEDAYMTRHDRKRIYFLFENASTIDMHNSSVEAVETTVLPSESRFNPFWQYLKQSQSEYKQFLVKCTDHELDVDYLTLVAQRLRKNLVFSQSADWAPAVSVDLDRSLMIEDFIDRSIILDFISDRARLYSKLRVCRYCEDFFVYADSRQFFCSPNHRKYYSRTYS